MIPLATIREIAAKTPDKPAISENNRSLSWRQFEERTIATIALLQPVCGDSLTQGFYVTYNRIELLPWLAAAATLGIPMTGIDYTLDPEVIVELINAMRSDLVVFSCHAFPKDARTHCRAKNLFDIDAPYTCTTTVTPELDQARPSGAPFRALSFTSGTSGTPKSVIRTQSFEKRRFEFFSGRYSFSAHDKFLVSMPLYHAAGNGWAKLFLSLGATIYLAAIDSPHDVAVTLATAGITASVMHPNLLRLVLDQLDRFEAAKAITLRWLLIGGKHFSPLQKQRALARLGDVIYEYYGTTETGVNTLAEPCDLKHAPASVGRVFDGNTIAIVDTKGKQLPANTVGRVAVASYMNMSTYGDGSVDEVFLDDTRHLQTPDHGYIDDDGRLYLVNRAGNSAHHSSIYQLEDRLRTLEGVVDVCLAQQPGSSSFDCVFELSLTHGIKPPPAAAIKHLAATLNVELARIYIVDGIPYSPSGKVRYQALRRLTKMDMVA